MINLELLWPELTALFNGQCPLTACRLQPSRTNSVNMPQPKVKLVVTGDDFGYCPRRNRGIVECFLKGGVSNVSLLVNATSAMDAAELAKR